jgi:GNAT superfamily N-acetyltransferase
MASVAKIIIRPVTTPETYPLRILVLRDGDASLDATYDGDDDPGTTHFGAFLDGVMLGTSTWLVHPPDERGGPLVRLRGMAVAPEAQGLQVGRALVDAGLDLARAAGARKVWASARLSAMGFYERCGFTAYGPEYLGVKDIPHRSIELLP